MSKLKTLNIFALEKTSNIPSELRLQNSPRFQLIISQNYFVELFHRITSQNYFVELFHRIISQIYFIELFRIIISYNYFIELFHGIISQNYFVELFHRFIPQNHLTILSVTYLSFYPSRNTRSENILRFPHRSEYEIPLCICLMRQLKIPLYHQNWLEIKITKKTRI